MGIRAANDIASDEICIRAEGSLGRITLNRPKSINALTFGMVQEIARALTFWRDEPRVRAVVLDRTGERVFCAGGDIRALYDHRTQPAFSSATGAKNTLSTIRSRPILARILRPQRVRKKIVAMGIARESASEAVGITAGTDEVRIAIEGECRGVNAVSGPAAAPLASVASAVSGFL
jgi:hypothetical protein